MYGKRGECVELEGREVGGEGQKGRREGRKIRRHDSRGGPART